jgi:hypothetical protein
MGLYGNIVIYPAAASVTTSPADTVREILRGFAAHKLVVPDAASIESVADDYSATFEDYVEDSGFSEGEYAYACVGPEQLSKGLGELVYILDVDMKGRPGPIELPYLEISAFSKPAPLLDQVTDSIVGEVCAAVEFSYEDARLSEDVHRVHNENHPVLGALSALLGAKVKWTVIAG